MDSLSHSQVGLELRRVRMNSLLFLSFGLAVAAAVTPENIRIIQEQSALVAEASLAQVMNKCMLK